MKEITHVNATSINEAVAALGAGKEVIAGGTDLYGYMKGMVSPNAPDTLVNIKTMPGLDTIKEEGGILKIGALTKLADIAESTTVKSNFAALAEAANRAASPELRNMGTIGGNICQKIRCWYYRAEYNHFNCIRKNPSSICYALIGDNRYNSIFGAVAGCIAVNCSDTAPALIALNAKIVTSKQTVDAENFFAVNGEKTTILADDEIVTEVQVPAPAAGSKSAFVKFAIRKSFDFPIVNCAAAITSSGGTVNAARICLNGVHNLPHRATAAEQAIGGKALNAANAEAAGTAAVAGTTAVTNNKYMIQVAKTMVKRAILATA